MSKKTRLPQAPHHILLYNEDWEYLETHFGPNGIRPVGVSKVIRALVHQKVIAWREAEIEAMNAKRESKTHVANIDSTAGSAA